MSCIHKCCPYHQKSVQEEACLQPLTSSKRCACHASQILDVHIRPLVDVHLRPLFDVHFRPPSRPSTHSGTQIGPWVDGEQVLPKHLYVDGWILYLESQINLRGWTWIKRPNSRDSMFILWLSMMDSSHRYLINHGINRTSSRIQPGLPQLSTVLQGSGDFLPTSLQQGIQGLPLFCGKGLGTPWNLQMSKRYGKTWNFNKIIIMIYKMNVWPGDNLCIDTKSMKSKRNRHRARVRVFLKSIALVLATESRSIKLTCYCQEMKEAIVSVKDAVQSNQCRSAFWNSQKVGKGQFVHKVGRAAVYKFWAKHTGTAFFDFYTTTITKVWGEFQRRNLQTMNHENRIQSNTSYLVEPLMDISTWGTKSRL